MAVLFASNEDIGFTPIGGNATVDAGTIGYRRGNFSRCALAAGNASSTSLQEGWQGKLLQPSNNFWFTAQYIVSGAFLANNYFPSHGLAFLSGNNRKIVIRLINNVLPLEFAVFKVSNAGVFTQLGASTFKPTVTTMSKIDVNINYSSNGFVKIYTNGVLVLDTGVLDVTSDGDVSLDGFVMGNMAYNGFGGVVTYWSEVIAMTQDTRNKSLMTLAPVAVGNTSNFDISTVGNINETTNNDTTRITASTDGQVAQYTVDASKINTLPSGTVVTALAIETRSLKGSAGPASLQTSIRHNNTDHFSASTPLDILFSKTTNIYDVNPVTGQPWKTTDLSAAGFNIGVKAVT